MFDLFRSREKSTRYLLTVLLSLVALSMVVTLIPGFGSPSANSPNDQIVADVGKDTVTMREVQMSLQDTLRGKSIPPELISIYAPQIVNQIVNERALAYYAKNVGYTVTDEDVARVIQMQVPQLFEGGKFVGKDAYAQFLASNNTTIAEYERRARMLASLRRIQGMVLEGMVVTPAEIEAEYRARNEKVTLDYVKLDPAALRNEIKVTPEELQAHWLTSKSIYKIPEKRGFRLVVADEAKISESMKMADDQLRRYYDSNKETFRTLERVKARHILIKTMEKPKEEAANLKKKTEDLLKQIKGGADFAEIAKKNSEDASNASKGGDLGFFAKGQMVPEFEKVAFSMKPGQISDIVTTSFGYHIIQVTDKEEARLKPFEEVKDQIQKEQSKQLVFDRMQAAMDQARAALVKDPNAAEQLAGQLGLNYAKVEKAGRGDVLPLVGASVEVDDVISQMKKKGEVSDLIQLQANKLALVILDDVIPERAAEMNEVESQMRTAIVSERAQRLLMERSSALMDKVRAENGDLRKAAAALKMEVKTSSEFGRDGNAEGIGPGTNLEEAFKRDVGAVFGPVTVSGSTFVCKIAKKSAADMGLFEAQKFDILLRLKGKKAQERKDLFEDGLMQHLQKKGIVKIHKDTVKRLVESFKNS